MGSIGAALIGLVCGLLWLVLLMATDFSIVTVNAGLLAALCITGRTATNH